MERKTIQWLKKSYSYEHWLCTFSETDNAEWFVTVNGSPQCGLCSRYTKCTCLWLTNKWILQQTLNYWVLWFYTQRNRQMRLNILCFFLPHPTVGKWAFQRLILQCTCKPGKRGDKYMILKAKHSQSFKYGYCCHSNQNWPTAEAILWAICPQLWCANLSWKFLLKSKTVPA